MVANEAKKIFYTTTKAYIYKFYFKSFDAILLNNFLKGILTDVDVVLSKNIHQSPFEKKCYESSGLSDPLGHYLILICLKMSNM